MSSAIDYILPPRKLIDESCQSFRSSFSSTSDVYIAAGQVCDALCNADVTKDTNEEIERLCATVMSVRNSFEAIRKSLRVFDDDLYKDQSGNVLSLVPRWDNLTQVSCYFRETALQADTVLRTAIRRPSSTQQTKRCFCYCCYRS
jgi:hypothetical protein